MDDYVPVGVPPGPAGLRVEQHIQPVLPKYPEHRVGDVPVLQGQELAAALDHRHLAAEPPEHLGELEPDIAATQHDEVVRYPIELHDRGRVEWADFGEAGDLRRRRPTAGVDEDQVGPERPPVHRERARCHEPGGAEHEIQPSVPSSRRWLPVRKLSTMLRLRSRTRARSTCTGPIATP